MLEDSFINGSVKSAWLNEFQLKDVYNFYQSTQKVIPSSLISLYKKVIGKKPTIKFERPKKNKKGKILTKNIANALPDID